MSEPSQSEANENENYRGTQREGNCDVGVDVLHERLDSNFYVFSFSFKWNVLIKRV